MSAFLKTPEAKAAASLEPAPTKGRACHTSLFFLATPAAERYGKRARVFNAPPTECGPVFQKGRLHNGALARAAAPIKGARARRMGSEWKPEQRRRRIRKRFIRPYERDDDLPATFAVPYRFERQCPSETRPCNLVQPRISPLGPLVELTTRNVPCG